jgi:hypothetical protein
MKRFWCSLQLKVKNLLISVKECNKHHLMDEVWYQGERYFINQGNLYDERGNHYWEIVKSDGIREQHRVQDHEIKRVFTWWNIKNALFHHYKWWKSYWYWIDLRKMMEE